MKFLRKAGLMVTDPLINNHFLISRRF